MQIHAVLPQNKPIASGWASHRMRYFELERNSHATRTSGGESVTSVKPIYTVGVPIGQTSESACPQWDGVRGTKQSWSAREKFRCGGLLGDQ